MTRRPFEAADPKARYEVAEVVEFATEQTRCVAARPVARS
jgi:hypothetical protein